MALKYKVGDRVRIKSIDWYNANKDEDGDVPCGEYDFVYPMTKFCGKILTIDIDFEDETYLMKEDTDGFVFTTEMFEVLAEDRLLDDYEELTDRAFKGGYEKCKSDIELNGFQLPEGYIFKDENGNEILTNKIILEKKKKEYPKTYEECCKILNTDDDSIIDISVPLHYNHLLISFTQLLICRDAYWKIAGEEMGLGKPWEPTGMQYVFSICRQTNEVVKSGPHYCGSHTFEFPTEEMRDAFKENFKELIESCKELL